MLINVLLEILGIIFLWLGIALSVLIHETGHMAGYKLAMGKKTGSFRWDSERRFLKQKTLISVFFLFRECFMIRLLIMHTRKPRC